MEKVVDAFGLVAFLGAMVAKNIEETDAVLERFDEIGQENMDAETKMETIKTLAHGIGMVTACEAVLEYVKKEEKEME